MNLVSKVSAVKKYKLFNTSRIKKSNKIRAYRIKEKYYGYCWEITVGDPDDHPSVPHAHSKETGCRLNVWTGEIYPKGNERKKVLKKIKPSSLNILHNDEKFIEIAIKQIEWYRSYNPLIKFYVPDWFIRKHLTKQEAIYKKRNIDFKKYMFLIMDNNW